VGTAGTIFEDLFNVIANTYGGASSSAFNVPDLRSRFPVGAAATSSIVGIGTSVVNASGGSSTIAETQLPGHTHPATLSATTTASTITVSDNRTWKTTSIPCTISGGATAIYAWINATGGGNVNSVRTDGVTTTPITITAPQTTVVSTGSITASASVPTTTGTVTVGNQSTTVGASYWQPHTAVNYIIKF